VEEAAVRERPMLQREMTMAKNRGLILERSGLVLGAKGI
jgi:hypothetical protein